MSPRSARRICTAFCWLALASAAELVDDARAGFGHIVYLHQNRLRVIDRVTGSAVEIHPDGVVIDCAMLDGRRIAVLTEDRVAIYNLAQPGDPPRELRLRHTRCVRIAPADVDTLWCLGRGADNTLLNLMGPEGYRGGLLQDVYAGGLGPGRLGEPQLLAANGATFVWLAKPEKLFYIAAGSTGVELPLPPLPRSGRSSPSFAVTPDGALFALAPLADGETFETEYGLFVFDPRQRNWRRWFADVTFARGTVLVGAEGRELAVWRRTEPAVRYLALP